MKTDRSTAAEADHPVSLCSLRAGPQWFGIDTRQVREVLRAAAAQPVPLAPDYFAGVVPYRGEVLTTVSLRALLGLERSDKAGCVLVLDDEDNHEQFGLLVDGVGGVATIPGDSLESNPPTLDVRNAALFDGAYRMQSGLMVRLNPQRLRPSRLAESGLFGPDSRENAGRPQ